MSKPTIPSSKAEAQGVDQTSWNQGASYSTEAQSGGDDADGQVNIPELTQQGISSRANNPAANGRLQTEKHYDEASARPSIATGNPRAPINVK